MKSFTLDTALVSIEQRSFEVVERKGLGHPDTLADGVAEAISLAYSNYCIEHYGAVLHHNVDKTAIFGGLAEIELGTARMIKPHRIILSGRISSEFGGQKIDFESIQQKAAIDYIQSRLPHLSLSGWLEVHSFTTSSSRSPYWFHPRNLDDVPDAKNPWANDTSVCVGYWPLSLTEQLALSLEGFFYKNDKPAYDFVGQDIKVMAIRKNSSIEMTMCVPLMAEKVSTREIYRDQIHCLQSKLLERARQIVGDRYEIALFVNTQDQRANDIRGGNYLTCSGSALDFGEEGMVGRGNRSRGIISSVRPYSMEASNGKNPAYHVGKVYGYIVDVLSQLLAETFDCEAQVAVSTRMGDPLLDPHQLFVSLSKKVEDTEVRALVEHQLTSRAWTSEILSEQYFLPRAKGESCVKA
jgi:S-adenosylmethionine synthetase